MILTRDNIPFQEIMHCGKFDLTSHTAHKHAFKMMSCHWPTDYDKKHSLCILVEGCGMKQVVLIILKHPISILLIYSRL